MSKQAKPIPEGYHTITPFLSIKGAAQAIEFYKKAFNAQELERHGPPNGPIMHAVVKIGDSRIMLADEFPDSNCGIASPQTIKGCSVMLHLYVPDVDASFDQAVKAGAKIKMSVQDTFWGDRYGQLEDPFGHQWSISTHKFDVTEEEINRKGAECMQQMSEAKK